MNRYTFIGERNDEDAKIITAPHRVVFKILSTKKFKTGYKRDYYNTGWRWESDIIEKYLIKVIAGTLNYTGKGGPFDTSSGEIWVGKKWIDQRLKQREKRNAKKPIFSRPRRKKKRTVAYA